MVHGSSLNFFLVCDLSSKSMSPSHFCFQDYFESMVTLQLKIICYYKKNRKIEQLKCVFKRNSTWLIIVTSDLVGEIFIWDSLRLWHCWSLCSFEMFLLFRWIRSDIT
jgi:hypothetical protein